MEETVTIELFGQPHTFKANLEVAKVKEVADLLVEEVARVENQQSGQLPNISKLAILMLAALNIANEHMELKRNYTELLRDVTTRSTKLIHTLDNSVQ
ncbi:MAG: cell division protein ZapA [Deltaproteobacteria bacterium]|nr:cell division protein ZapA [Deltaproteobacteria bacterium]